MCSLNNQDDSPALDDQPEYRTEKEREVTIKSIRNWRSQNQLSIHFTEVALNPYFNGARTMEIYEDENGYEYWVDPRDDRLVQAAPAAGKPQASHQTRSEDKLPVAELRKIAWAIMERSIPDFAKKRSSCHPLEDNRKRQVYFFRFDDASKPISESDLPPFVQVGLRADGQLISFTDTLPRSEQGSDSDTQKAPLA